MDPQLKALNRQIISIAYSTATVDIYGEAILASPATVYARVERHERTLSLENGDYAKTSHLIILDENAPTPSYASRFWLDGSNPSTVGFARIPKIVNMVPDERGNVDHWEIIV
jgi:hypothetical protein